MGELMTRYQLKATSESYKKHASIHLPDLLFVQYCGKNFGINRGIYNTIDEFLYEKGIMQITRRREVILNFLLYLNNTNGIKENGKINFNNYRLSNRLEDYCEKTLPK